MKTLIVMRHAKSSWKVEGQPDHDRPLNDRGKRDAPRMGRWLAEQDVMPDCILSSSAKRARKTAEAVTEVLGCSDRLEIREELYGAGPDGYVVLVRSLPDSLQSVMIVGHDPTMSDFVSALAKKPVEMPTAAIAGFTVAIQAWREFSPALECELHLFGLPRELAE